MSFGQTIFNLRDARHMAVEDAADLIGMHPADLVRIELGSMAPPSDEVIRKIARIFGADPDVLIRLSRKDVVAYLNSNPAILELVRLIRDNQCTGTQIVELMRKAERMKGGVR